MKEAHAGRFWFRQPYDPEYPSQREISPKREVLNKVHHISDRTTISLRAVWRMSEEDTMECLMDGGFIADACLDRNGSDANCPGVLKVNYRMTGGQEERKLICVGTTHKHRHKMHWLQGSIFQGHTKLSAADACGVVHCFGLSKDLETTSSDTGLSRRTVGILLDRLRLASALVAEFQREALVFEDCQVEADETVIRKERVYETLPNGEKRRIGTWHHSIIGLTQRGSTKTVVYMAEPHFVRVDARGKPSPPSLPTTHLILPLLTKHFGKFVILHTDGAEAYRSACEHLKREGYKVVHDSVIHSQGQYTAFGRHDVSGDLEWEGSTFAGFGPSGKLRIRVAKGTEKIEGYWRHVKHSKSGLPMELSADDKRLNVYLQSMAWRKQVCGDPFTEVLRMARSFRALPMEKKRLVFRHGLRDASETHGHRKSAPVIVDLPEVVYTSWHLPRTSEEGEDPQDA